MISPLFNKYTSWDSKLVSLFLQGTNLLITHPIACWSWMKFLKCFFGRGWIALVQGLYQFSFEYIRLPFILTNHARVFNTHNSCIFFIEDILLENYVQNFDELQSLVRTKKLSLYLLYFLCHDMTEDFVVNLWGFQYVNGDLNRSSLPFFFFFMCPYTCGIPTNILKSP